MELLKKNVRSRVVEKEIENLKLKLEIEQLKNGKKIRKIVLRHKFVTTLINLGQLIKKISAIVGHASITMTERKLK